jgi:ferric iron reductase protein FhuF
VGDGRQEAVARLIPGAAALGLIAPPSASAVPARLLADPAWTAEVLDQRAPRQGTDDRRVLATVWWYSVSSVLLTPPLTGLVTGVPLSGRLADTSVFLLSGGLPVAAVSSAPGADLAGELRKSLMDVIAAVAEAGRMRERPLWAIATDSIANRLLALGRALGEVPRATALAAPLAAAVVRPCRVPATWTSAARGSPAARRAVCSTGCRASRCAFRAPAVRRGSGRFCSRMPLPGSRTCDRTARPALRSVDQDQRWPAGVSAVWRPDEPVVIIGGPIGTLPEG